MEAMGIPKQRVIQLFYKKISYNIIMEQIKNNINKAFEKLFGTNKHPFFTDIEKVNKLSKEYNINMKKYTTLTVKFTPDIIIEGSVIKIKYNVLKQNQIIELKNEITNVMNWNKILNIVSFMSQHLLESNVKNETKLYKIIKKEDVTNIMIIGSGPIGLYIACYLNLYYNNTSMNQKKKVNIVIYENRIEKGGFKKPYTRQRPFVTSSAYLNLIIPKIYCWNKSNKSYLHVNIFMLEYILYAQAITQSNISFIYNNYSWDEYVDIIDKGKFKIVFDCSGGKLKHNVIKNINTKWLNKFTHTNTKLNKTLSIMPNNNLVELKDYNTNNKFKKNYYYGSILVHTNENGRNDIKSSVEHNVLTFKHKYDIDIVNKYDLLYLNTFKNKYYTFNETIDIIKGISDEMSRNFLFSIFTNKKIMYTNCLMTVDVFSIYIRHSIKIADTFKVKHNTILLIGAGDTIFHSHFITGSGLNKTIDFTVKCVNMIDSLL